MIQDVASKLPAMNQLKPSTVTISLSDAMRTKPMFVEGDKIKLGKNSWWMSFRRIKNKMMVHRMLKKEYYPYMKVVSTSENPEETTLTVKPFNF